MTLSKMEMKTTCLVTAVAGEGAMRRRLLDMGITPGTRITVRKIAPMGDPMELFLRGYSLTIRKEDAEKINVRITDAE